MTRLVGGAEEGDVNLPVPGVFYRWESESRYYLAGVQRDLLGDWVVMQCWGGRYSGLGSHKVQVVASEEEGLRRLVVVGKVRVRHGYQPVRQGAVQAGSWL